MLGFVTRRAQTVAAATVVAILTLLSLTAGQSRADTKDERFLAREVLEKCRDSHIGGFGYVLHAYLFIAAVQE